MAQFDAAELITQREAVSNRIRTDLLKRAQEFNIALEDVSITHMTFGREFTRAVEQKQIAQQDAERARFIVEKAEQERQANVIRAEGEADAADIISKAVAKAGDATPTMGEDGIYHYDWYHQSFLELADDLEEALDDDKIVMIKFDQKGCI